MTIRVTCKNGPLKGTHHLMPDDDSSFPYPGGIYRVTGTTATWHPHKNKGGGGKPTTPPQEPTDTPGGGDTTTPAPETSDTEAPTTQAPAPTRT